MFCKDNGVVAVQCLRKQFVHYCVWTRLHICNKPYVYIKQHAATLFCPLCLPQTQNSSRKDVCFYNIWNVSRPATRNATVYFYVQVVDEKSDTDSQSKIHMYLLLGFR